MTPCVLVSDMYSRTDWRLCLTDVSVLHNSRHEEVDGPAQKPSVGAAVHLEPQSTLAVCYHPQKLAK